MNKYRIGTDVPFQLSVDDGVEYLDLSNCTILNVAMYCDAQEAFAGACTWQLNADDHTRLDCVYPGDRQAYTGIMRAVVVMLGADGGKKAYDLADIFEIVATTEESNATEATVTSAVLSAWQLPMSTLATIVEAAINATEAATETAIAEISYTASTEDDGVNVLHIEQEDGTVHSFNIKNGSQGATGATGPQGPQGLQGNTGSSVDYPFELVNNETTDDPTKAHTAAGGKRLKDEIAEIGRYFTQPANVFTIAGKRRNNDGTISDADAYNTTELLPLSFFSRPKIDGIALSSGSFRTPTNTSFSVAYFYDAGKALIGHYAATTTFSTATSFPASAIPAEAVYIAFNQYDNSAAVQFVNFGQRIIIDDINSGLFEPYKPLFGLDGNIFTIPGKYRNASGGFTDNASYRTTELLDLDLIANSRTDGIAIATGTFRTPASPTPIEVACFYDSDKAFLSSIAGGTTYSSATPFPASSIPANAKYIAFNQYSTLNDVTLIGYGYQRFFADYQKLKENIADGIAEGGALIANDWNNIASLTSKYNAALTNYIALCGCSSKCMTTLNNSMTFAEICEAINHNSRYKVVDINWDAATNAHRVNAALAKAVYRFCDAKMRGGSRDFSIGTGLQADEPSAIVSPDGGTLYIYAHLKRISTADGVNWSEPSTVTLSGGVSYLMHININYIDGVYYLIGTNSQTAGNLYLFTSTDGLNFSQKSVIYSDGQTIGDDTERIWGNTYLLKANGSGTWYLFVEYLPIDQNYWKIAVATTNDLDNGFTAPAIAISWSNRSAGNPDIARGCDNAPLMFEGNYYMYYHSTDTAWATIRRAKSPDLINWTDEGIIFDNRDQPTGRDETSGNADHTIIEFKGRTYLFYTWDINNASAHPYIKYTIDNRRFRELLTLRP